MGKVIVMNWVTLDGVMQGPGRPDEDTRDGFERGGWGIPYGDEATVAKMGERMGGDRAFLFGRRTYEQLLASWNARGGPFKDALNNVPKYVASSNPATRLDWPNSTLLHGDVPAAVANLKQSSGTNLVIMRSGALIGSLTSADLIDEHLLTMAPLVLGTATPLRGFQHSPRTSSNGGSVMVRSSSYPASAPSRRWRSLKRSAARPQSTSVGWNPPKVAPWPTTPLPCVRRFEATATRTPTGRTAAATSGRWPRRRARWVT